MVQNVFLFFLFNSMPQSNAALQSDIMYMPLQNYGGKKIPWYLTKVSTTGFLLSEESQIHIANAVFEGIIGSNEQTVREMSDALYAQYAKLMRILHKKWWPIEQARFLKQIIVDQEIREKRDPETKMHYLGDIRKITQHIQERITVHLMGEVQ